ncbi:SOS response-associated peptidase [Saccharopolyspora sp. NFXS83]|uniref:SOS response-associated peptidase n=1 Tax=Saccharopolyspora sp. NFXS83 TaxID=2993560 RepID=UPI00224B0674|nr:SOS response-associated peptidase [Saccharopolyspora sp. NFXS83]MCX2732168.1 SOS response-associated peptidase [Saccharopolyspora sp. NFXS83]
MCGRYASTKDPAALAAEFDAADATGGGSRGADYNVAPTKQVPAVVRRHPRGADGEPDPLRSERGIRLMRWGLVPKWAKNPKVGSRMINAKAETVTSKPAFRTAAKYRRCLLPADGWYEWKRAGERKQPYFMTFPDDASLAMAGIWETWHDPAAAEGTPPLVTCSVLTTAAIGALTEVHDRMPLVLPAARWDDWLDPDRAEITGLLGPSRELVDALELRPVSSTVNDVRNNGAELIARQDDQGEPVALDHAQDAG